MKKIFVTQHTSDNIRSHLEQNPVFSKRLKRAIIEEIREDLDRGSAYSSFKRWIIRDNPTLNQQFKQHIKD